MRSTKSRHARHRIRHASRGESACEAPRVGMRAAGVGRMPNFYRMISMCYEKHRFC